MMRTEPLIELEDNVPGVESKIVTIEKVVRYKYYIYKLLHVFLLKCSVTWAPIEELKSISNEDI